MYAIGNPHDVSMVLCVYIGIRCNKLYIYSYWQVAQGVENLQKKGIVFARLPMVQEKQVDTGKGVRSPVGKSFCCEDRDAYSENNSLVHLLKKLQIDFR